MTNIVLKKTKKALEDNEFTSDPADETMSGESSMPR